MSNPMQEIKVEKITLNIGAGGSPDKLEKATKLLNRITGAKPVKTSSKLRIPTWGVRPKLPIACKVTLRGKAAEDVLKRLFEAVDNRLDPWKFDDHGNFSFGIQEYIDIPGVEYDVSIGIIGLEVAVTLARPGFRVKRRRYKKASIPERHRISQEEAIAFTQEKFKVKVEEE